MTLLLENRDLVDLMPFEDYVDAVEAGYREVGEGRAANLPRTNLWIDGHREPGQGGGHLRAGARGSFKFKGGFVPGLGGAGIQAYTAGLPAGLQTFLFLFDTESGALDAVMEVLYYDWIKTAAVAALATKLLAPPDASRAGLFGTGRHARSQLRALVTARPIQRIDVFSREAERRQAFCRRATSELGIDVVPADTPEAVVESADVITTITTSPAPVFDGRLLTRRPVHINAMGAHYPWVREIDEHVVVRSHIILDDLAQGMQEEGEVLMPIAAGTMSPSDVAGDMAQLVAGTISGRSATTPWTLFLSGGTGIEDVSVATRLVARAREKGVGRRVDFGAAFEYRM